MDKIYALVEDQLGWIVFNNPERRNAISYEMWEQIPLLLSELNSNTAVRVIVLKGAGSEAFVAGADISEFKELRGSSKSVQKYNIVTQAAFNALKTNDKPLIAMINGFCFGGGCAIAIHCDLRIAADNAKFCIPAAKLGLGYGNENLKQVVHVIGAAHAKEMLLTAKVYNAEEAKAMGLVNQRVATEDLESFTKNYALVIADNAPLTLQSVKLGILQCGNFPHQPNDQEVDYAMNKCYESADYQEGIAAFLEKRKPVFKGN